MRLSQLSTDKAMDVLCEITAPISSIISDEDLINDLRSAVQKEGANTRAEYIAIGMNKIGKLIPHIFRSHRKDVYEILSIMNEKSEDEIARQGVLVTMCQIREIIKDKEFLDFFKSCADSQGIG